MPTLCDCRPLGNPKLCVLQPAQQALDRRLGLEDEAAGAAGDCGRSRQQRRHAAPTEAGDDDAVDLARADDSQPLPHPAVQVRDRRPEARKRARAALGGDDAQAAVGEMARQVAVARADVRDRPRAVGDHLGDRAQPRRQCSAHVANLSSSAVSVSGRTWPPSTTSVWPVM